MSRLSGSKLLAAFVVFLLAMASTLFLNSCGGGGGGGSTPAPKAPYIIAGLISTGTPIANFKNAFVTVQDGSGNDITDATVTMNGVQLVYNAAADHQEYEGNLAVAPQGTVTLSVTIGSTTYTASGTQFTTYPTVTQPSSGSIWSSSTSNPVQWTGGSPATNAVYTLAVLNPADPNGQLRWPADNNIYVVPITTTSYSVPPLGSLNTGNGIVLVGINKVVPIPNASSDSGLVIGGYNSVPITIN